MDEKSKLSIPYIVHEGNMARLERTIKRLWILCILLVLMLVGSNAAWIWFESQWEVVKTTTQEVTQDVSQDADSGGSNNFSFVGGDNYGEAEDQADGQND